MSTNRRSKPSYHVVLALVTALILTGCTVPPAWTPVPVTTQGPAATVTPLPPTATTQPPSVTPVPPTATTAPATATPPKLTAIPTAAADSLAATLEAGLPPKAFTLSGQGGVKVLRLTVSAGSQPLWAAYTYGMRNFDLNPTPEHFVAIYTQAGGQWQELARHKFSSGDPQSAAPDYVGDGGVTQVQIAPGRTWLQAEGGVGAHGGVFNLLSFDGKALKLELANGWVSPGAGFVQDVNDDGMNDVVLNATDRYVFCYACGVAKINYVVYSWSQPNGRMVEAPLQEMLMGQSGHPGRPLSNEAVMLARAGLWKDAMTQITAARQASAGVKPPFSNESIDWNFGIIKLHADAMAQSAGEGGYPLLSQVFYGDYPAAVHLMRPYPVEQLFRADTPLVKGTVADGWAPQLTGAITTSATAALLVRADLASAYFLRGWAAFLASPAQPSAQVKADLQKAAALAPTDVLFTQAAAFLAGGPQPTATTPVQVKRIEFAPGATSANVEGRIAGGATDTYVLRALQGQWAEVSIYAAKSDVVLEIYGVSDGQPLLRSSMRRTNWAGILPATQDYGVKAVSTGGNTTYTLQVIIPERITFAPGAISTTAQGNLTARETHNYLLRAMAGQTMTVTITSPRSDVLLEIYGISDGSPLVRVPMGVSAWTGKLPGTQDYAIKAVSVGAATSFKIQFVVK